METGTLQNEPMEVGLSLGSNLGDRLDNLRRARALLAQAPDVRLIDSAPVYETEPVEVPPEFAACRFLNTFLIVETSCSLEAFWELTRSIEERLGRDRAHAPRNGPRVIDLDIIYAGDGQVDRPGLRLPHPRWQERAFVVRPLADVRPNKILPDSHRPVAAILADLDQAGLRHYAAVPW